MTVACLEALERQEHALDVHVILVNNRSADPATLPALRGWMGLARRNRYTIADDDGPFNFARINNAAFAAHGEGKDLLLFLNNDVELESPDCLRTLAAHLLRDEGCAFAGIRLVYPGDRAIQHAGIVVGEALTGSGYHMVTHAPATRGFPEDEHVTFAVTFACAMTRCRTYRELGLLEEIRWPNGFGDIEICARALERGYRNHYFGTLVAIHHESRTRGRCVEEFELTSLYERHAGTLARWRLRTLSVDDEPAWPVVLPLRYKVADRVGRHLETPRRAGSTTHCCVSPGRSTAGSASARIRSPTRRSPIYLLPPGEGAPKGRMRGPASTSTPSEDVAMPGPMTLIRPYRPPSPAGRREGATDSLIARLDRRAMASCGLGSCSRRESRSQRAFALSSPRTGSTRPRNLPRSCSSVSGFLSWPGGKATSDSSTVPSSSVTRTRLGIPAG